MSTFPAKILVATDDSKQSRLAVELAVELANKTQSELHIVHVGLLSPWLQPVRLSGRQIETLKEDAQKTLDRAVEQAQAAGATVVGAHLRIGRPDGEVITLGEEIGAAMIVVGCRGRDSITRIPLGRDSENIVKHALCPVLVVRDIQS